VAQVIPIPWDSIATNVVDPGSGSFKIVPWEGSETGFTEARKQIWQCKEKIHFQQRGSKYKIPEYK